MLDITPEFQRAFDYMESEDHQIVFITGDAGTGKSTLLRLFSKQTDHVFVKLAPTGLAAVNIEGETIHSFFELPLGIITPEQLGNIMISDDKIEIIKNITGIIIDEVSMVRADIMDAIDALLRRYSKPLVPFGGKKLVMFGDLFQLEPILNKSNLDAYNYFNSIYSTHFFYGALVFNRVNITTIRLNKIFRQEDPEYIEALNHIRKGVADPSALDYFNNRMLDDDFNTEHVVILCSLNAIVNDINEDCLGQIETDPFISEAIVEGEFAENLYPAPTSLKLKVGAQVMMLRNNKERKYYNGNIGEVLHVSDEYINVFLHDSKRTVRVDKVEWENIHYKWDKITNCLDSEVVGTFKQFPMQLAWAITVHKAQGLTLEKAIINLGNRGAFCHGQLYVALSRCRNIENMALVYPIRKKDVITHKSVVEFDKQIQDI